MNSRLSKKTIQQYLNEVNYDFTNFVPSEESLAFFQFIKEINGGSEENTSPLIHSLIFDKMTNDSPRTAILAHRGAAKSSIIEYICWWLAVFGEIGSLKNIKFAMFIANSIESGVKSFRRNMENRYANSDFLQKFIPNQNLKMLATDDKSGKSLMLSDFDLEDIANAGRNITDLRLEFKNKDGKPFCIRSYGVKTGIRGAREYNTRPTLAFFDDLISDADARSDVVIEGIEEVVYKAVPFALHPTNQKIIWVGTPFNSKDPLYKAIESGLWDSLVLPVCEKFPCSEKEFRGSWEDRFTYKAVLNSYEIELAKGSPDGFYQEMMLQIISDEQLLIPQECLQELDNNLLDKVDANSYNYYITTDFAFSEKTSADYSVISVWAYTANEDFILVDGICKKQTMDLNIKDLFRLCSAYRPLEVGIEITGQQKGFVEWIRKEQARTHIWFNVTEIRPTKDKFSRFLAFSHLYLRKKIFYYKGFKDRNSEYFDEYFDEVRKVTKLGFKSKHDDVLDTNSMLLDFTLFTPNTDNKKFDENKDFSFANYYFTNRDEEETTEYANNYDF